MQSKIEVVKSLLKTYAKENGVIVRSTSDLSPLEGWLLNRCTCQNCNVLQAVIEVVKQNEPPKEEE